MPDPQYLSTDPNAGLQGGYLSTDPNAGLKPTGVRVDGESFAEKLGNAARMIGTTAKDVAIGAGKGALHSGLDLASMASRSGMLPGINTGSVPSELTDQAREATPYSNTAQGIGGALETVAEFALPVTKAAEAVPTVARAGAKFQTVMGAARNIPVDIAAPGNVALRISELAERGASMPMAVRKFLNRITDPEKAQMTYEEARDFASNISRLSANEYQRLTPVVAREVASLRVTLNQAVGQAASKAGKGVEYAEAMRDYARAMRLRGIYDTLLENAKRGAPWATAGAGTWLAWKLRDALGGE